MNSAPAPAIKTNRSLLIWALGVLGLTGLAVWWLHVTGVNPDTDFSPANILIAYSSSLVALIVAALPGGGGVGALLKQVLIWRVSWVWYALALLGPLALVLLATLIYILFGNNPAPDAWLAIPAGSDIGGMIGPLIAGCLGEEIGWRGYGQRLLQQRTNVFWASLIVGLLWATWHSWPALAPGGAAHAGGMEVFETYLRLVPTAVIYGWIFTRTGGSVLLVMLAHAGHNIAVDLIPAVTLNTAAIPLLIACLYFAAAAILVALRPGDFFRSPQPMSPQPIPARA